MTEWEGEFEEEYGKSGVEGTTVKRIAEHVQG